MKGAIACLAGALLACSPGLGKNLRVDNIVQAGEPDLAAAPSGGRQVRVLRFEDRRGYSEVGEIEGRMLQPAGSVALNVQLAAEQMLRARGIEPSQFTGTQLGGKVLDWRISVHPAFPSSRVRAAAKVRIEIRDDRWNLVYGGVYSGAGESEHPLMDQYRVEQALGQAMHSALAAAFEDPRLLEHL